MLIESGASAQARTRGRAQLIEPSALAHARTRLANGARVEDGAVDPVLFALRESNARALQRNPGSLARGSPSWNLFVMQTCLLELSLSVCLEGSASCAAALSELIVALDPQGTSVEHLPSEVHVAFVTVGLAIALELARDSLQAAVLASGYETVERLATRLAAGVSAEAWGQRAPNRAAWNHSIVAFSGLGVAGLVLPGHRRSQEWVALAAERALLFFEYGITPAGMTREGLSYCGFVFRNLFPFLLGARDRGAFDYRDPGENPFLERLARVPSWYAGEVFPSGTWLRNLNDSYWDPNPALAGFLPVFSPLRQTLAEQVWRRTLGDFGQRSYGADNSLRWSTIFESLLWGPVGVEHDGVAGGAGGAAGSGDVEGAGGAAGSGDVEGAGGAAGAGDTEGAGGSGVAAEAFFHCPDVGYLRQWTADRRWGFSFNCGAFIGSIHDQSDNNSFTLFAAGVPFILDAGAANRAEEGGASSSCGHSAILIEGRGQALSGGGLGVSGSLDRVERTPTHTVVSGDATASYVRDGYNPVLSARRTCLFAHGSEPYLLVSDDIQKDQGEHEYEFLLHTPTPAHSDVEGQRVRLAIDFDGACAIGEILVLEPQGVRITSESFTSLGQPPFERHTLWRIVTKAVNPRFIVLFTAQDTTAQPTRIPPAS